VKTLAASLMLAAALTACSGSETAARRLPDTRLPTLAGIAGPSLAQCTTDKCLTVLVAPWCSVCHRAAPSIVLLRRFLDKAGVASRVVVGASNDLPEIKKFAAEFGPDALLDEGGALSARGVPLFLVTDRQGRVLKAVDGFPNAPGPEELARYLELL
jgi:thiol-disulfide isomerase/thioredoxin